MKSNTELLTEIVDIQIKGKKMAKLVGILTFNPLTIGLGTGFLKYQIGFGFILSLIASILILAVVMFFVVNLGVGVGTQSKSTKLYNSMTESYAKTKAYEIIKEDK